MTMLTPAFVEHYPLPWRIGDLNSPEVVDRDGSPLVAFEHDSPEDREFWENVVTAVNCIGDRSVVTNAVGVGMAIAAGILMSCWGDETKAAEILGAAGLRTVGQMRAAGVDAYDIRLCVPVLRRFRDQAKRAVS